jgi:hypothetical protein
MMRRTVALVWLWSCAVLAQPLDAAPAAESSAEASLAANFARTLAGEGDHYRAIGEYKRALFLAPGSSEAGRWRYGIAESYRRGEQHDAAVRAFDELGSSDPGWRPFAALGAARSTLAAGNADVAVIRAREAATLLEPMGRAREAYWVEAWALLKAGRDAEAKAAFERARGDGMLGEAADRALAAMPSLEQLPTKSPALAGALGLVPGLGHLYLGEPGTALSALAWNGVFAWALVDALRAEQWSLAVVLGMFEAMWYGGSIVGAVSGAHRYNHDARVNALEDLTRAASPALLDDLAATSR